MFPSARALILFTLLLLIPFSASFAQSGERILIAYFTWAENTRILDRERTIREANGHVFSMENRTSVDTVTTASVLPPGNTARLARWVQEETGGDIYSIQVREQYSCYWDECLNRASREKARRARPELTGKVENLADYDVIFLGFPTWWYTIPMAVAHFVEIHDLSGKTVIPFVSHGTSGIARTIRDLEKLLPASATLENEIGVYRSETSGARGDVLSWLESLGYAN